MHNFEFLTTEYDDLWLDLLNYGLFQARCKNGWTIAEVAEKSGLSIDEVDAIEMIIYPLRVDSVLKLASIYNTPHKKEIVNALKEYEQSEKDFFSSI